MGDLVGTLLASGLIASGPVAISGENDVVISGLHISNPNGSCVKIINGSSNVTIENSEIGPCGDKGIDILGSSHIKINGNYIHDTEKAGIYSYQSSDIAVDSNVIEDVKSGYEMFTTTVGNISFSNNFVKNVHRGSNNGGNIAMIAYVHAKGIRINNNVGINVLGESNAEDLINIFKSDGTADDPILVSNNKFYGGGPSSSGGGIMLGDQGGSYQLSENNILVNPGGYGIAIAGGHHITHRNNRVYSDDQRDFSNIGVMAHDSSLDTDKYVRKSSSRKRNTKHKPISQATHTRTHTNTLISSVMHQLVKNTRKTYIK